MSIKKIALDKLIPTPENPRTTPKKPDDALRELAESLKNDGQIVACIARPHPTEEGKFDLRAGARRLVAARLAKLDTLAVEVFDMTDEKALQITVIENEHRRDFNPIEEGKAAAALLKKMPAKEAAAALGWSLSKVLRRSKLTKLCKAFQRMALGIDTDACHITRSWGPAHWELFARLPKDTQEEMAQHDMSFRDLRTADDVKKWIARYLCQVENAPWDVDDTKLVPGCPACQVCNERSNAQADLFADLIPKKGVLKTYCLNPVCWRAKVDAHLKARIEDLAGRGKKAVLVFHYWNAFNQGKTQYKNHTCTDGMYGLTPCKATDKGACLAIHMDGEKAGIETYVKKHRSLSGSTPGPGESNARKPPTPLAERRKLHFAKCQRLIIPGLLGKLESVSLKHMTVGNLNEPQAILALAATFGTAQRADTLYSYYADKSPWDTLARYADPLPKPEDLWVKVRPVLVGRLSMCERANITEYAREPRWWAEAQHVAAFTGYDLDTALRTIQKQNPEPAAWSRLNADGTPKTKKDEKKKDTTT